ncbi:class I SAM-dependent methyltransferase [Methylomonas sp. 2BW1-5-20]|uniref:class I SAM-dependent methyltransferase n=1 Tax=Methylomonas sp. 2BW1-5-20 TaxID=3376686 RepID=UPI00404E28ED
MLDPIKVKKFWDSRSRTFQSVAFESIANLEQNPENLEIKIRDENSKVFAWLPNLCNKSVLDLGAGVGQWTFRFAERQARKITAVEFSENLAEIGRNEAVRRDFPNIEFVVSPAEKFETTEKYDVIFISGLFVYLNDDQAEMLVSNLKKFMDENSIILVRDGSSIVSRYEINNKFSEHLQADYSATYRTREEYLQLFNSAGFKLIQDENMFAEGHPLNKYPETRLRLFLFNKI